MNFCGMLWSRCRILSVFVTRFWCTCIIYGIVEIFFLRFGKIFLWVNMWIVILDEVVLILIVMLF